MIALFGMVVVVNGKAKVKKKGSFCCALWFWRWRCEVDGGLWVPECDGSCGNKIYA